jgi:CheY-like chemotaxis protein
VLDGVRVLVVDDEGDARELVAHLLGDVGAHVQTVGTGAEALAAMRDARPDLLISDIGMPGMDGFELIRRVRELPLADGGGVPAIALTAFARSEERTRSLQAGYQLHVAKPVEQAELIAAIASLVRRRPPASSLAEGEGPRVSPV